MKTLLLVLLSSLAVSVSARADQSFCLQHFNMYGPIYAPEVTSRTKRVIQQLTSENPECDVVQFIEVWSAKQARQVINGMGPDYEISAPNLLSRIGIMSLIRGDIQSADTYDYIVNNEDGVLDDIRQMAKVKKAFHVVVARLPQLNEDLYFVNTHLHPTSSAVRIAQILDLYNWRLLHQDKKMVLSGDFNSESNSLERDLLMRLLGTHDSMLEAMGGVYPPQFCSYCEANPRSWLKGNHLFDYVFFSNVSSGNETVLKALQGIIDLKGEKGNTLSDHYGVRVRLGLRADSGTSVDLGDRRNQTLQSLQQAMQILQNEKYAPLNPYIVEMSLIATSLNAQSGSYWNYFSLYH